MGIFRRGWTSVPIVSSVYECVCVCVCRKAIPLNENEGVYVRNIQTGQVRCVYGPRAYMLQANEELDEKELTPLVEDLLR